MLKEIRNTDDVAAFMLLLVEESVNAHPDEDFNNYVSMMTGEQTYTPAEAALRNKLMDQSFDVCESTGTDIYSFMQEIFLKATGMDEYIPLPSAEYPEEH